MSTQARRHAISLALFLAAAAGVWVALYQLAGGGLVPGSGGGYRVEAVVPDALALTPHADVRQAGVRIGEVEDVRGGGGSTALKLRLDREHAPVYRDARVLVRLKSVAGEPYVEVDPGTPRAGVVADGGRLTIDRAQEATQIDDVLSVLDEPRRRQLRRALRGLGGGLDQRGADLNRFVEGSAAVVESGAPLTETIAATSTDVATLVDAFGRVTAALGDQRDEIRRLVSGARTASDAVAGRDARLRQALRQLPATLRQVRGTATGLAGFSRAATPVVADLRVAVQELATAMVDLRTAAPAGRRLVRELAPFARAATPAFAALRPFGAVAARAVPALAADLREANPLLAHLRPYERELSSFFANVGSISEIADATGHVARVAPLVSRSALPGTLSAGQEDMIGRLTDALRPLTGSPQTLGYNAYPAPGEAGASKPFTGRYTRLVREPPYR